MTQLARRERQVRQRRAESLEQSLERLNSAEYTIESGAGSVIGLVPAIREAGRARAVLEEMLEVAGRRASDSASETP